MGEGYLDKYSIDDAVADGATVPIHYTSRKTDRKTLEIFKMVYCGKRNKDLVETLQAEPRDDAVGLDAQRDTLRDGLARDLMEQYRGYLETRFPVTVNRGALDALF